MAPESGPFSHRDKLSGLEMGVAETGQVLPSDGEDGQRVDRLDEQIAHQAQGLAGQDQVGVVGNIATGRPQMDDRAGQRSGVSQGMDMGHHVVSESLLVPASRLEIDRIDLARRASI